MIWFKIDGVRYDLPCSVERTADMQSSNISGMLLDKTYFNDVIGTYMTYAVSVAIPRGKEELYSQLYEVLTEPVEGHVFELPYNQKTLCITARVEGISDRKYHNTWRGIKFNVIANNPTKEMSLGEVISHGKSKLPNITDLDIGRIYIVDEDRELVLLDLGDADVRKY